MWVVSLTTHPSIRASIPQAAGQSTAPGAARDVDALLAEAWTLHDSGKITDATAAFERALDAARRLGLEPQQAGALCGISRALATNTQYREAREFALQCLAVYERLSDPAGVGRANLLLNYAAELTGDYAEARTRAARAIDAFESAQDRGGRAAATLNLLRVSKLEPADGDRLLARAIDDARATKNRTLEASALHSWGDGLFNQGRYEESYEKLQRAADFYQALGDQVALGTVFNSLGRVYRAHGQLDEALEFQRKALRLHEAAGQPLQLLQSLNAVGAVHNLMGHVKEAREYYERALAIAEKSSAPRIQDFLRANIAALLTDMGEYARGASMLEEVIAHGIEGFPGVRYAQLSYARVKLGQLREGLAAAEKAVDLCGTAAMDCIQALRARAQAYAALDDRDAALADVTAALNRIEEIRKRLVPVDFFKQEFHRALAAIYSEAIALSLSQRQDARALETAELARSRAFLDLLATRAAGSAAPPVSAAPAVAGQPADLRSLVTAPSASVADITATAGRLRSTFVLYWVADDAVVAWVVTPEGEVRARRVSVLRSRLDELVRATSPVTEAVSTPGLQGQDTRAWRELYTLLIQPVRDALPRARGSLLTIVPHGPLLNLSFAALRDANGRYLLEDYTIHYAPAASMLQFTTARAHPAGRPGEMLLVADPVLPARSRLDRPLTRLPGARAEVAAIARLVPRSRVTILQDAQATEAGVHAALAGQGVLHFATHAIVRDDDPLASFLVLGPSAGGAGADGLLTAQEVYTWRLDADLIVLSACRSAGGRITGDGVATFARAFIYAGTPSLVASLWDVADEPTNRLLPAFYRAWLGGQSKARALRAAQLQLLADLRAGTVRLQTPAGLVTVPEHPAFWAGFALMGEPD
jgi:CHAT domain-containing protein